MNLQSDPHRWDPSPSEAGDGWAIAKFGIGQPVLRTEDPTLVRGEGRFTDDPLETFGGAGVAEIPQMQKLLRYICENGFEHHVAANLSTVAGIVHEVATRYMGWETYWHGH